MKFIVTFLALAVLASAAQSGFWHLLGVLPSLVVYFLVGMLMGPFCFMGAGLLAFPSPED